MRFLVLLLAVAAHAAVLELLPAANIDPSPNAPLQARAAVPTKTVTKTKYKTKTVTVQGANQTKKTTVTVRSSSILTVRETALTTTTSTIAKRAQIPTLEKRAPRTSTVTKTVTKTRTKTVTNPGSIVTATATKKKVVKGTTTLTVTATSTALTTIPKTSSSTSQRASSSSTKTSSSATSTSTSKLPFAYPEIDTPSVFQRNILKQHNDFRAKFGSPALTWDTSLASFAQKWTDRCGYFHSIVTYPNPPWSGENIAAAYASSASMLAGYTSSDPVEWWGVDEFKLYSYNPRTPYGDHATGHFQNMVWKSFSRIGCAVSYCPNGLKSSDGSTLTTWPGFMWSCDFDYDTWTDWSVDYNIPRNITKVY